MPYYSWLGVDLEGNYKKGKHFARSVQDLDKYLINKDIGLIKAKESKFYWLTSSITESAKINLISYIASLLKARVRLHQALKIASNTIKNNYFKSIIQDIEKSVYEGKSLSEVLDVYKNIFDELTRSVISAGEASSNLSLAFEYLDKHNQVMHEFRKKIKSALLVPLLTISFFIIIVISLLIFVIPRFEIFFLSVDKASLPMSTYIILAASKWFRSWSIFSFIILFLILFLFSKLFNFKLSKYFKDKLLFSVPILSNFLCLIYQTKFLQMLSLLLRSGVHITQALKLISNNIDNLFVKKSTQEILYKVETGKLLNLAFEQSVIFNSAELISLITIGESSGDLAFAINQASVIYQNRIYSIVNKLVSLIQPVLLIILGGLIAGLIVAVYVPIFTLSSAIN